ncbi:hypothetical protein ACJJIK_15310 [Microbulbifer sp. ZKSA006]|uniref:hypothetical protein n=1 Tax=Microbulbifer sp. ZKSA006 TaxID=3243390 RepID=UPI00403A7081
MKNNLISKICDPQNHARDLLVDELNDEIEAGSFSKEDTQLIVHSLLKLLPAEQDQAVNESILNLLSSLYPSGITDRDIEVYVLDHIKDFKPGSLIHALSILSESKLNERKAIFSHFSKSDNTSIQEVVRNYLLEIDRKI